MLNRLNPGTRLGLTVAETVVTAFFAFCWLLLSFAMYAESYDLDPSVKDRPEGRETIATMAYLAIGSLLITWIFRGNKRDVLRNIVDSTIVLRFLAVAALSILMFIDLVNG
ncbi:hypothetical protein OG349_13475 [Streptomyces sp. NBC_01317]|uniref:hypothetical protein n=1 Tax=Streptomyces sp. NBC_01317 TaxID=2903822 RepID=UPI002E11BEE4|nr:hypothetical protein OG349_13475 [Streptomyces sp. NBC_01317]